MNDSQRNPRGYCSTARDLMRVLGGARRYEIIVLLAKAPSGVTQLADRLCLEISAVSHDLRILRDYGFVHLTKSGTRHEYRLSSRLRIIRVQGEIWLEASSDDGGRLLVQSDEVIGLNASTLNETLNGGMHR